MGDTWYQRAADIIASVHATLPADIGRRDRIRALSGARPYEYRVTSWGRKTWGRAAREYLDRYRLEGRPAELRDLPLSPLEKARLATQRAERKARAEARKFPGMTVPAEQPELLAGGGR